MADDETTYFHCKLVDLEGNRIASQQVRAFDLDDAALVYAQTFPALRDSERVHLVVRCLDDNTTATYELRGEIHFERTGAACQRK